MNPSIPISVLMVGCGGFARRYHVPAFDDDGAISIVGIFDPFPTPQTRALAERCGAALTARIEDLPRPEGLAFSLVTTPHTLHADHIGAMLDRRMNVLVDKPYVMTAADATRLAERADAIGVANAVAYNRRFDRGCLRAREILRAHGIGDVRFVQSVQLGYERAGWFLDPTLGGGGPYTGRATHMADLVPWLLGRSPTALRSRLRPGSPTRSDHGGFIELKFGDLECQMTCIEEGWHMWDEVRIFGDDGLIELRRPLTAPIGWQLTWLSQRGERGESLAADSHPGDATRDFFRVLREGGKPACTFAEAIPSARMVELAFAAARDEGRWFDVAADRVPT